MSLSVLILTGLSGSGKSTAVRALEDRGYFCVDNIPVSLVEQLITVVQQEETTERLAVVIDARERGFIKQGPALVERLRNGPNQVRLVFLQATEATLVRRYSETRRAHPLDQGRGLRHALTEEVEMLVPLQQLADDTVDTSGLTPHQLRDLVERKLAAVDADLLRVALVSFGFKHGLPLEADIVFDVRFLPNPYFEPQMRELTGEDAPVRDYVLASNEAVEFLERTAELLAYLLPRYRREGKRYLTVAVGCTGGQHRSVLMARELRTRLQSDSLAIEVRHRDIDRRQR